MHANPMIDMPQAAGGRSGDGHLTTMQDLKSRLEKLLVEAEDCDLIANLATDQVKRRTFKNLATQLRQMAADVRAVIDMNGGQTQPHDG